MAPVAYLDLRGLGQAFKKFREIAGETHEQVSTATGIHLYVVKRFESGHSISFQSGMVLCHYGQLDPLDYFHGVTVQKRLL